MKLGIILTFLPHLALAGKISPPQTTSNLTEDSLGVMETPSFVLYASPDGASPPIGRSDQDELEAAVKTNYLDKFPKAIDPVWFSTGISAIRKRISGGYAEYDVQIPNLGSCVPRLSKVVPIAEGLFCSSSSTGCSYSRQVTMSQSYSTTAGVKVGATVTAGSSWGVVSAEVSISTEASWEETFTSGSSESNTYTFNLPPGESCIPSMIHVELECDVSQGTYWHDTNLGSFVEQIMLGLTLEFDKNRHEPAAPYGRDIWGSSGLQYCRYQTVDREMFNAPTFRPELWKSLISDEDPTRGKAYIGNNADLDKFLLGDVATTIPGFITAPPLEADELVFFRTLGTLEYSLEQPKVLRCKPARPKAKDGKMLVPLKGSGGVIQGFIGCI